MGNADKNNLIRIYGITLPESKFRVKPYGHGMTKIVIDAKEVYTSYVDYFINDLIALIKQQNLEKNFLKELGGKSK